MKTGNKNNTEKLTGIDPITYGFAISQIAVGAETYECMGASWLYDQEGNLVGYSLTIGEDDPSKSRSFGRTESRMRFDKDANRHILVKKFTDHVTGNKTYSPVKADETDVIEMLKDVRYGKKRLWYIIRDWNDKDLDLFEPELPLDTTIDKLINDN